ncbi:MAG: hypothetical protein HYX96_06155 [Chloroflexi bacterium]|nr:hypothetical protein [Chloroflexota bacterium]
MVEVLFAVSHETWLKTEGDRIQGFILMPRFWGARWDHRRLQKELAEAGLGYTLDQIAELNDELHKRGIVADVAAAPDPVLAPEPAITEPAPPAGAT